MKGCYGFSKGIEVAGKLVDRQLQIIDDAQQKAADFLKKEVSKYDAGKEVAGRWQGSLWTGSCR